ncbi:MAG: hypothetical protein KKE94_16795 [Gammaproteobacteria bacterium]|nr:hypothetical protein [Gammaproteobacteria bacterium]
MIVLVLLFGCASTSRPITSNIVVAEYKDGNKISTSKVHTFILNDGTDRATLLLQATYASKPNVIHKLYIENSDIPVIKAKLTKALNNTIRLRDMTELVKFGGNSGELLQITAGEHKYISIRTAYSHMKFPNTVIPDLLKLMEEFQEVSVVKVD